jgi:hypothetical protein
MWSSRDTAVKGLAFALVAAVAGYGGLTGNGNGNGNADAATSAASHASPGLTAAEGGANVIRAAARTTLAGTAGVRYTLEGANTFGSTSAPVLGSGRLDFRSGAGAETIDLSEVGHQEPGNEGVVFEPGEVYLQPKSSGTAVLPKGKTWMSATLAGSESVSTNFPSFVLQVEAVNPQLLLEQLAHGAVSAVPAGVQIVEGLPTKAYDVTVSLTDALSGVDGPAAPVLGQAIQSELAASSAGGDARGPQAFVRVWLDSEGHVVRLRANPPGAGVGTATMTMCCFGSVVQVSRPSPAQVIDITALTPSGERENNGGGDSDGG